MPLTNMFKQQQIYIYYWTLDGEWLIVDGKKVRANGKDGVDGTNGINGKDGGAR